jgi:hypothetical protein
MRLPRTALGGVLVVLLTGCAPYLAYEAAEVEATPPDDVLTHRYTPDDLFPPGPTVAGWEIGRNDVVLTLGVKEGYGGRDETVSFDSHGWVVRAADTSVFGTKEDYTTWRIDRTGLRKVLAAFDRLGVREPGAWFGDQAVGPGVRHAAVGWADRGVERGAYGSLPLWDDGGDHPGQPLWDLVDRVVDPAWHRGHVVVAPRPWVPTLLGVLAQRPGGQGSPNTTEPFAPWPLRRGIRELSHGVAPNPYGEPEQQLCLYGREAARVFDLLEPGVNTAWLRVDDGRRWELTVEVVLPSYSTSRNPCGGF